MCYYPFINNISMHTKGHSNVTSLCLCDTIYPKSITTQTSTFSTWFWSYHYVFYLHPQYQLQSSALCYMCAHGATYVYIAFFCDTAIYFIIHLKAIAKPLSLSFSNESSATTLSPNQIKVPTPLLNQSLFMAELVIIHGSFISWLLL